jgi:hypothetical protein
MLFTLVLAEVAVNVMLPLLPLHVVLVVEILLIATLFTTTLNRHCWLDTIAPLESLYVAL